MILFLLACLSIKTEKVSDINDILMIKNSGVSMCVNSLNYLMEKRGCDVLKAVEIEPVDYMVQCDKKEDETVDIWDTNVFRIYPANKEGKGSTPYRLLCEDPLWKIEVYIPK